MVLPPFERARTGAFASLTVATMLLLGSACAAPECTSPLPLLCPANLHTVDLGHTPSQGVRIDLDGDGVDELALVSRLSEHLTLVSENGQVEMLADLGDPQLIARAELDGDGLQDLAMVTAAPGQLLLLRSRGDGTLDRLRAVELGGPAYALLAVDLNSDGRSEFIVSVGDRVRVFDVEGAEIGEYELGPAPAGLAVGDLDDDGAIDLVVVDFENGELTSLRGDGAGGLRKIASVALGVTARDPTLADVDGDGALDALVRDPLGAGLWLAKGDGAGGFAAAQTLDAEGEPDDVPGIIAAAPGPDGLFSVSVVDDGVRTTLRDGETQAVALSEWSSGELGQLPGPLNYLSEELLTGQGYAASITLETGAQPVKVAAIEIEEFLDGAVGYELAVGDFDGDGLQDIAVLTNQCTVFVQLGDGAGELQGPWSKMPPVAACHGILAVDIPGDPRDGLLSFAYHGSSSSPAGVQVVYRDEGGTFDVRAPVLDDGVGAPVMLRSGGPALFAVERPDGLALVTVDDAGDLRPTETIAVDEELHGMFAADVDGDGDDELLIHDRRERRISVYRPQGEGLVRVSSHDLAMVYPALRGELSITTGDLNADGVDEAVVVGDGLVVIIGALGSATPNIASASEVTGLGRYVGRASLGDLDGDGDLDLSLLDSGVLTLVHGDAGGFVDHALRVPVEYGDLIPGDLDGDERLDLLTLSRGELSRYEARDVTLPRVSPPIRLPNANFDQPIGGRLFTHGDIDGDGLTDILTVIDDSEYIVWGDGGRFARITATRGASLLDPSDQHITDLDGDGQNELLTVIRGGRSIIVRRWEGSSWTYQPVILSQSWDTYGREQTLTTGDLDGDGLVDAAVAWGYSEDDLTIGVRVAYADPTGADTNASPYSDHTELEVLYKAPYTGPRPTSDDDDPRETGVPPSLQISDIDGDGLAELIFDGGYDGGVLILWNDGDRRFSPQLLAATSARALGPGDLVLTADRTLWRVPVYGRRLGTPAKIMETDERLWELTECDGDGLPDLMMGTYEWRSIMLGVSGSFYPAPPELSQFRRGTFCDDLDGDSTPDLASPHQSMIRTWLSGGAR